MKTYCSVCGRLLKDPIAIARGMGKLCAESKGIQVITRASDLSPISFEKYKRLKPELLSIARKLRALKGENGNQLLFPDHDEPEIISCEKEKLECERNLSSLMTIQAPKSRSTTSQKSKGK